MIFKKGEIILILFLSLSFIFICTGTAGYSWVERDINRKSGIDTHTIGLWKKCTSEEGCFDYTVTHCKTLFKVDLIYFRQYCGDRCLIYLDNIVVIVD